MIVADRQSEMELRAQRLGIQVELAEATHSAVTLSPLHIRLRRAGSISSPTYPPLLHPPSRSGGSQGLGRLQDEGGVLADCYGRS